MVSNLGFHGDLHKIRVYSGKKKMKKKFDGDELMK